VITIEIDDHSISSFVGDAGCHSKFNELRKRFIAAHNELVEVIELIELENNQNRIQLDRSELAQEDIKNDDSHLTKAEFLYRVNSGINIFEGIDLENLDLRNQNLSGLSFINCLISTDFRNSNLSKTKFIKSNVKTSDFRNADLSYGLMQNVSFESTRFKGSNTTEFIFIDNYCYSSEEIGQSDFENWIKET